MKITAMVPIKMNNERTPGKNTKKFDDGIPLITFFLNKLTKIKELDKIYIFCSNPEIKQYIPDNVSYMQRSSALDTSATKFQDIFMEFMKKVDSDIYVVAHCTSPFVKIEHFEECIESVKSGEFDSSFTGEKLQAFLWKDGRALNFDPQNIPRTQDLDIIYNEIPAMYVFRKEVFADTRRRIGNNPHIVDISGIECVDIDYPEDFEIANAIYMNILKGNF